MITIFDQEYESYDDAAHKLLGVSKNSLYRFRDRENLGSLSITALIEYCISNGLTKEHIAKKRKKHFIKSFEDAMIEKYGLENYRKMFIPEENTINPKEEGFQSHTFVNIHCLCESPHYIKGIEIFKVFRIEVGKCPYTSHTNGNRYILKEDSLASLYPESLSIWSERNISHPTDIYPTASGNYWWKCENNFHDDYQRKLSSQVNILKRHHEYICPECQKLFGYKYEDLTGRQFGELKVLEIDKIATIKHSIICNTKSARTCKIWKCKCTCGKRVSKDANSLKYGGVYNCGDRSIHYGGKNNPNWRGGITSEHEAIRKSKEYENWRLEVYKKDHYNEPIN